MGLCTAFVFSALVEFTVVNFWFRKFKKQKEHALALMLPFVRTASNMTNVTTMSGLAKTNETIKANRMKVRLFRLASLQGRAYVIVFNSIKSSQTRVLTKPLLGLP